MQIQNKFRPRFLMWLMTALTLSVAMLLAACGDTAPTSTLVPLPTTSAAGGAAAAATTTTSAGNGAAATTTTNAGNGAAATTTTGTGATAAAVTLPAIPGTTEVQINAADFANARLGFPGAGGGRGGAATGAAPYVKIYSSDDDAATLITATDTALSGAGYVKFNFQGFGGGGGNGTPRSANPQGGFTPPPGFTPPANFTPPTGFTPGAGRAVGRGNGGLGIFQKDGAADILYNVIEVPADSAALSSNRFFSSLAPDVAQKLFDQVKGKKTMLVVNAAPGLVQGFANRTPGQGAGNRGGATTPTPTTN